MIQVKVRAHPGARVEQVTFRPDGVLDVRVRAPALDGRANAAVVAALAEALDLKARQVRLVWGERSRDKLVVIDLESVEELRRRLVAGQGR